MVLYTCPRCNFNNNIKTKYILHLNRKKICDPINGDVNLEEEYLKYSILNKIISTKIPQKSTKKKDIPQKTSQIPQKYPKKLDKKTCEFCNKEFTRCDSLNRHLNICKEKIRVDEANSSMNDLVFLLNKQLEDQKIEMENQKKEIEKRVKEMEEQKKEFKLELEKRNKQIDELIKKAGIQNSTITTNIQNNIKLLAYKDTDISKLTDTDFIKCINHNNMCVPHLIKMIHLDPKKPENHNIYISNIKNGYIMLYDGKKWNTFNRESTINDMIEDKQSIIEEKIEDWVTKGTQYPELMKKFERYLNKKENNEILNKIKDEIKLMLYNNRKLILKENEDV